uniref:C3H1-type domain-containing protein n=1 Tax=Denticeps clupeoides TaxID=299321 RepID=A0AAY4DRI4_9TELE
MAVAPVDPREVLKGVESFLGKDGELRSLEGVAKVFSLMKASHKMVGRCMYLNVLLQTKSHDVLNRFIRVGGYKLLNAWLTYSKTTNNSPMLQLILLTLQKLPLTVDHLKQNNTAKLVKQLSKAGDTEAAVTAVPPLTGPSRPFTPPDKKRKKEEVKVRAPEMKPGELGKGDEERKREKPKAHAPSHAKIRSTGLEVETPTTLPAKKPPTAPPLGDKYNIKPAALKRPSILSDTPPAEKKYKPLNTNSTKESRVKLIPAQPMECTGFLDALNSAPVPGIKIKKKSKTKAASPTSTKPCPFDGKPGYSGSQGHKPSSPEAPASHTPPHEPQELEQPGTPIPAEDPEAMDTGDKPNALAEPRGEEETLTKKGKKKKSVRWAEEEQLKEYFYFDLDETERVNVNKIKDFGEAAKRELMMDRQTFEMARRLSHDTMEERVPWTPPRPLNLTGSLVIAGAKSLEKLTQRDREMGILQEIFLSKESVPDTPHEPDPESYEPMPPRLIPLDEVNTMEDGYMDPVDTPTPSGPSASAPEGSKLPPVLANLMGSLGNSGRSPQTHGNPVPPSNNSAINVQELLSSMMGAQNNSAEDLIKQPDFSDKIKQLISSLQQNQNQNPQSNAPQGKPLPTPPGGPHYNHPPPPHGHGPPFNAGGGPRMMGPPPGPQGRGSDNGNYWGEDSMRGGPPRGHFHRGRGRGGDQGFRGRGRGGPRGGHNNMGDMSNRPVCRHFMMKGNCRYENNCAFYHPGVNGPPLPPQH